ATMTTNKVRDATCRWFRRTPSARTCSLGNPTACLLPSSASARICSVSRSTSGSCMANLLLFGIELILRLTLIEQRRQQGTPTRPAGLNGSNRRPDLGRDILPRHVADVVEHDHPALTRWDLGKCGDDRDSVRVRYRWWL